MTKENQQKSIQIIVKSSIKASAELTKLIRKLLSYIPEEHLEGLGSIILSDWLPGTKHRNDPYLYRKQSKSTFANIELSLNKVYHLPKIVPFIPFVRKWLPAHIFYKAVGDHYMNIKGVTGKEREELIKEYAALKLRKAFPVSTRVLRKLMSVIRWFRKDTDK